MIFCFTFSYKNLKHSVSVFQTTSFSEKKTFMKTLRALYTVLKNTCDICDENQTKIDP